MKKLRWNGEDETFFHYNGVEYKTQDYEVEVPDEVAIKMLSHPRFEEVLEVTFKKKKSKKEE